MNNWKYADSTNVVVYRTNEDGSYESCLVSAITDWLSEGNTPEPADVPPPPSPLEQIRALEAQYADAQTRATRQALLVLALDRACADPAAAGLPREAVHEFFLANDPSYAALYNLEAQVAALRSQV